MARVVAVVAAIAVLFVMPVWTETRGGYAEVPIWWAESGAGQRVIWKGVIIDGLAVLAILVAVFWPRLKHR